MINKLDRGAKILIGALAIGILIIGVSQMITGSTSPDNKPTNVEGKETNHFNALNAKIELLKSGALDPNRFNAQEVEIDSYLGQKLITDVAANSLKPTLYKIFAGRVYKECDYFLKGIHGNSAQNIQLLNILQSKIGVNSTINGYKTQITWYQYYSTMLPNKVNAFIQSGIANYTDAEYQLLKNQVQNMPGLNSSYSKSAKFQAISNSLMKNLFQFNYEYSN